MLCTPGSLFIFFISTHWPDFIILVTIMLNEKKQHFYSSDKKK